MAIYTLDEHVLFTRHDAVKEICKPLVAIDTLGFIFMRCFPDGTFVDLSNQLEWSDFFIRRFMGGKYPKEMVNNHMMIMEGVSLWALNPSNIIWQEGMEIFNFGNGVSLFEEKDGFTDIFCFYSHRDSYHMNEFYAGNIDLLKKFSEYFLVKAESIIREGEKQRLCTPDIYINEQAPCIENLPEKLKFSKHELLCVVDEDYRRVALSPSLSKRELQCIMHSASGKPSKQVASCLDISTRTVEAHLYNARMKLECSNLGELISLVMRYCAT